MSKVIARRFFSWCNRTLEKRRQERLAATFRLERVALALVSKLRKITAHVLFCHHKTCLKQGGKSSGKALRRALRERNLRERVMITKVKCLDQCGRGPVMVVYPEGVWYGNVDENAAREIVTEHLEKGRVVAPRVLRDMRDAEGKRK